MHPYASGPRTLYFDGIGLVVLERDQPVLALTVLDAEGDTVYSRQITSMRAYDVTDEMFDAEIERRVQAFRNVPAPRRLLRDSVRRVMRRPRFTHALYAAAKTADAVLWLGQRLPGLNRWHAVDARSGAYLGMVELPPGHEVKTGNRDHLWILERDADGVEFLVKRTIDLDR
jgi:hypothetical protein